MFSVVVEYVIPSESNAFATEDDGDDGTKTTTSFVEASLSALD